MKILHIVPSYKPAYVYGGPIESVAKLCEGLVAAGHTIAVYTTTANGETELPVTPGETVVVDGVPVTYCKRITKDHTHVSPALWKRLYNTCRQYDVVHIHSWWNVLVIVAAVICHRRKVKVVISPRGMLSDYILTATNSKAKQIIHSLAGKQALRKSFFHATSDIEYEDCKKLIPGWQGFMIPNIITLPDITIRKTENERFTLLFLSRIHPKKGIEFLMEALTRISEPVILKIAGTGEESYINQLKQQAKELGVADKIEWLGWKNREEKFVELINADLFVLVSHNENFANVVIESLHVGTPVLVSDKVGLASFVARENMGWVTRLHAGNLAAKLGMITNEKAHLEWIRKNSRSVIHQHFSEPELIARYEAAYRKVLTS